jgi:hypothetical protein
MARLPTPGGDDNAWGNVLNTFLSVAHNSDGTLQTSGVVSAATGSFAQLSGGKLTVAQVPDSVPAYIYEVSGSYPLRNTVTSSSTRTVIWVGIDAPTISSGYAINDVDIWEPTSV